MRRDYRDRPPRPWDNKGSIWGNLSLSIDEPKKKASDSAIPASGNVPVRLCNAMARKGFLKYSQVDQKDGPAIFNGMISALEDKLYGGIRSKRY